VKPSPQDLLSSENQADYLVLAPRDLLPAAEPLIEHRQAQGLASRGVALEDVYALFSSGEKDPAAIRSFLAHAFHHWSAPSPRYVLLFGDASYDPKNFTTASTPDLLPPFIVRTTFLWTVSDPALAAVNGDDLLPDLAIGRLPVSSPQEADALVQKILNWESSPRPLDSSPVLVADNPDTGGNFEANILDIRSSFLQDKETRTLFLSQLGSGTRPAILSAFNEGASLMSYVGHGGSAVWASENILSSYDAASLSPQSAQPLLLTLNCLNGYFIAPNFNSLAEAFLKPVDKGVIAALSPSSMSFDAPAHVFHRAVLAEVTSHAHARLGDALLAAQTSYAFSGAMPELLNSYQLLGDPALKIE
jgi:hypothetical protein